MKCQYCGVTSEDHVSAVAENGWCGIAAVRGLPHDEEARLERAVVVAAGDWRDDGFSSESMACMALVDAIDALRAHRAKNGK